MVSFPEAGHPGHKLALILSGLTPYDRLGVCTLHFVVGPTLVSTSLVTNIISSSVNCFMRPMAAVDIQRAWRGYR